MCLSVPSRVIEIKEDNTAVEEVFGARRLISLDLLLEEIGVGDWVLVHVYAYAIGYSYYRRGELEV